MLIITKVFISKLNYKTNEPYSSQILFAWSIIAELLLFIIILIIFFLSICLHSWNVVEGMLINDPQSVVHYLF